MLIRAETVMMLRDQQRRRSVPTVEKVKVDTFMVQLVGSACAAELIAKPKVDKLVVRESGTQKLIPVRALGMQLQR